MDIKNLSLKCVSWAESLIDFWKALGGSSDDEVASELESIRQILASYAVAEDEVNMWSTMDTFVIKMDALIGAVEDKLGEGEVAVLPGITLGTYNTIIHIRKKNGVYYPGYPKVYTNVPKDLLTPSSGSSSGGEIGTTSTTEGPPSTEEPTEEPTSTEEPTEGPPSTEEPTGEPLA